MKNFNALHENILGGILKGIIPMTPSPEQPSCPAAQQDTNSNIGQFGMIQAEQPNKVNISQEEDGSIKIKSDELCVKLHAPVIEALKLFLNKSEGEE